MSLIFRGSSPESQSGRELVIAYISYLVLGITFDLMDIPLTV
jgi:Na+/melibiose symporter-like transporter